MFLLTLGIDENVVNEDYDKFVQIGFAHSVQEIHENRWCVSKTIWHDQKLVMAILSSKCSFGYVHLLDTELMVSRSQIDLEVIA